MGLEIIADERGEDVFQERYDPARTYALNGLKEGVWWWALREDARLAGELITRGLSDDDWFERVELSIREVEDHGEVFHLRLFFLDLFVPIDPPLEAPPTSDVRGPVEKLFVV